MLDTSSSIRAEVRSLARLAIPIALSLGAATLIGVVDTIMIAPLGTVPLAAASVTASVLIVLYSGLYGYASITGVRVAKALGRSDDAALSETVRAGLIVGICAGLVGAGAMLALRPALPLLDQPAQVIAVLHGYWIAMAATLVSFTVFYTLKALFDATDAAWLGVAVAFGAVALNMPANLLLIHGFGGWPGLGLTGAGVASFVSQSLSLVFLWLIWRRRDGFASSRRPGQLTWAELRTQLGQGSIIAAGYIGEGGAYAVAGLMMGWFSAAALTANQIVSSVAAVLYMLPLGVAIAVSIRVGSALGRDDHARLVRIGQAALLLIVGWMSAVMLAILLSRQVIAQTLSQDPEVITVALGLFIVIALMQVFDGIQATALGAARGLSDNAVPVTITLVIYWLLALPLGYWLGFALKIGPQGVWIGYGIGAALAGMLITRRFFRMARA